MIVNNTEVNQLLESNLKRIQWEHKFDLYCNHFHSIRIKNAKSNVRLSVIIIAWKYNDLIFQNVKSLIKQINNDVEFIFVNNGSTDSDFDKIADLSDIYLKLQSNTGSYMARNIGAAFAKAPVLLFLDDDALPDENLILSHLRLHDKYDIFVARGRVLPLTVNTEKPFHYDLGPLLHPMFSDIEGNTSYRASIFYMLNGWDDEIIMGGGGVDLAIRIFSLDNDFKKQIYSPKPVIYHDYHKDISRKKWKNENQIKSKERLRIKHKNWDDFIQSWNTHSNDKVILKELVMKSMIDDKNKKLKHNIEFKNKSELNYWSQVFKKEKLLSNSHYKFFFTDYFELNYDFYKDKKILDIGCGPRGSLEWADNTSERYGLDPLANDYVRFGSRNQKMKYINANSESIPFPDSYFDIVTSFNSLDHVDNIEKTIKEITRVLKDNGIFLLITDVNHIPTLCEPISFSWDILNYFLNDFNILQMKKLEKMKNGIYQSIRDNIEYDENLKSERYGILTAKCIKKKQFSISICIPTYNRASYLSEAIKSCLEQDYSNFEILIVDDGSTDNTEEVVKLFNSKKIRYIKKDNEGRPKTRNLLVREAKGEFILWLDDDDILYPNILTIYTSILKDKQNIDIIYCDIEVYSEKMQKIIKHYKAVDYTNNRKSILENLILRSGITFPGSLIRKQSIIDVGYFDESFLRAQDNELWTRLANKAGFFKFNNVFYRLRVHDNNISSHNHLYIDQSYESLVIKKIIASNPLNDIFPSIDWSRPDAKVQAYYYIAKGFFRFSDFYSCKIILEQIDFFAYQELLKLYLNALIGLSNFSQALKLLEQDQFNTGVIDKNNLKNIIINLETIYNLLIAGKALTAVQTEFLLSINNYINFYPAVYYLFMAVSETQGNLDYLLKAYITSPNDQKLIDFIKSYNMNDSSKITFTNSHKRILTPIVFNNDCSQPLVSVIIPTYNRRELLKEALKSVINQTYDNLEVIVINDCGEDVYDLILSFQDKRIKYVTHNENKGLSATRNTGLKIAQGKYIAYLDDDDMYYPSHISVLVDLLETNGFDIVYSDAYRRHEKKIDNITQVIEKDVPYSMDFDPQRILWENYIPVLCIVHKKECLNKSGFFDENLNRTEDWDLWIRMSLYYTFYHVKKITAEYRWSLDENNTMMSGSNVPFAWSSLNMFYKYMYCAEKLSPLKQKYDKIVVNSLNCVITYLNHSIQARDDMFLKKLNLKFVEELRNRVEFLSKSYNCNHDKFEEVLNLIEVIEKSNVVMQVDETSFNEVIKLIAFYLPQFHPIPENDKWWGKGFTEWTNVTKAKPRFKGHYQPRLPADLGYYDLRLNDIQVEQAELAEKYGLYGFCYYHYWFNGKRLLETPLENMIKTGKPDFPFCLCWANEDWTRVWDGKTGEVLINQDYNEIDDREHVKLLIEYFKDKRYIRINNKPLFLVYRSSKIPNPLKTTQIWREEAMKHNLQLYLCKVESSSEIREDPSITGFDCAVEFQPDWQQLPELQSTNEDKLLKIYDYSDFAKNNNSKECPLYKRYPCVLVSWDNSPRREGKIAQIFVNSHPDNYKKWLIDTCSKVKNNTLNHEKIVFINAWNEWAEGNYLEPDMKFGHKYLEATRSALVEVNGRDTAESKKIDIALCICTPKKESVGWGDTQFAVNLQKAFNSAGCNCDIFFKNEWEIITDQTVVLHLRGLYRYYPNKKKFNVLWIISHPELITKEEIEDYDLIFCASKLYTAQLKEISNKPIFELLQATSKQFFDNALTANKSIDLLFVGNNHNHTRNSVRQIIKDVLSLNKNYNLKIIGKYWKGYIDDKYIHTENISPTELPYYYSIAKINLNDHHEGMKRFGFINNRTYDLAALGQFQISDFVDGIEGLGVACYKTVNELEQKIDCYLDNEQQRNLLSNVIKNNVCEYTFENRAKTILETINTYFKQDNSNHFISICIPTYNRAKYIQETIQSALNQNYDSYEIVIVDDGSTDNTEEIVKSFYSEKIKYIKKEHTNAPDTRNKCIDIAQGDFILWLDSDDILIENILERYAQLIHNYKDVDVFYGDLKLIGNYSAYGSDKIIYMDNYKINNDLISRFVSKNRIPNPGSLVKKSIYYAYGMYDVNYIRAHDYEFWVRIVDKVLFKHILTTTVLWRWHDSNMSTYNSKCDYSYESKILTNLIKRFSLSNLFPYFNWNDNKNAEVSSYLEIAKTYAKWRDKELAFKYYNKAFNILGVQKDINDLDVVIDYVKQIFADEVIKNEHTENLLNFSNNKKSLGCLNIRLTPKDSVLDNKIKKTIKVLYVVHDFPPYKVAGIQNYVLNLSNNFQEIANIKIDILHPVFRDNIADYRITKSKVQNLDVYSLFKPIDNEFSYDKIKNEAVGKVFEEFLQERSYDLIHFHSFGQLSVVVAEIAQKHQIPSILTIHDSWFLCYYWFRITPNAEVCSGPDSFDKCTKCLLSNNEYNQEQYDYIKEMITSRWDVLSAIFKRFNKIVAVSEYIKNIYTDYFIVPITVNHLGFTDLNFKKNSKNNTKIVFGYIGQIAPHKGLHILIHAFNNIKYYDEIELHVYGLTKHMQYMDYLSDISKNNKRIIFFGEYTSDDLSHIFNSIDISVIPSLIESFPLVALEALQHKTPVIASKTGGIPEIIKEGFNGFLFENNSIKDLQYKLEYVLEHKDSISLLAKNCIIPKTIEDDVSWHINLYESMMNCSERSNKHILIYYFKNVHIPILKPITETLKQRGDIDLAVGYMHYAPEIRAGFTHEELEILKSYGLPMYEVPQDFKPDVTIIADSVYPWVKNCGKLINVGHGVLSKGQYYTNTETAKREELSDVVCVPGRYHKEMMEKIISKPVLATGMAKLDDLFSKKINRDTELQRLGLPKDAFYVLFAPTFNDELSAIPYVKDKIYEVLPDPNSILLIKLHGSTAQHYKDMYSQLNKIDKRVFYLNDLDITPYLVIADVLISDVSSVMMEFAALDKPVVLFNNPLQKTYKNYNSTDLEYTHRDIGYQVESLDEMKLAVLKLNRGIDPYKEKRKFITDMLFENKYTGQATQKIIETIMQI